MLKEAMAKINQGEKQFNKEMNQAAVLGADTHRQVNPEQAIYDNGDINSRNNKHVAKIQGNDNLSQEEKERLLKNHD